MKFRMDEIRAACEAEAARQGALTPEQRATEDEEFHWEKASMLAALATFGPERPMPDITEEPHRMSTRDEIDAHLRAAREQLKLTIVLDAQFGTIASYQGQLRAAIWKLIAAMEMLASSIDASPPEKAEQ